MRIGSLTSRVLFRKPSSWFKQVSKLTARSRYLSPAFFYGVIFGNLTAIIQRLYSSDARTVQELRVIKDFTENHELPAELQSMLSEYIAADQTVTADDEIKRVRGKQGGVPAAPVFPRATRVALWSLCTA